MGKLIAPYIEVEKSSCPYLYVPGKFYPLLLLQEMFYPYPLASLLMNKNVNIFAMQRIEVYLTRTIPVIWAILDRTLC